MYFVLVKISPSGASLSFLAYTFSDSFCVDSRVVAFQHFEVGAKLGYGWCYYCLLYTSDAADE